MTLFAYLFVVVIALTASILVASRSPRGAGFWLPTACACAAVIAAGTMFASGSAPLAAVLVLGLMPFAGSTLVMLVLSRSTLSRARWSLLAGLGGLTGLVTGIPAAVFLS